MMKWLIVCIATGSGMNQAMEFYQNELNIWSNVEPALLPYCSLLEAQRTTEALRLVNISLKSLLEQKTPDTAILPDKPTIHNVSPSSIDITQVKNEETVSPVAWDRIFFSNKAKLCRSYVK